MAKKREDEAPAGLAPWMATFSDLMNLLLCFFVLLFSMSTVDAEKLEQVVASFNDTFSIFSGGASSIGDGVLVSNGVSQLNELSEYINSTGATDDTDQPTDNIYPDNTSDVETDIEEDNPSANENDILTELEEMQLAESETMAEDIEEMLTDSNANQEIDVDFTSQYVLLTFKGAFLFDSGKATLKPESLEILNKAGAILETYSGYLIEIEGHTDNQPVGSGSQYADNDELSSARALAVFHYFLDNTLLDPIYLKHSGRGEYVPVADNTTAEGRAKNRRVEIKIYNSLSSY